MADNTPITAGSGTSIATDDIGSVFFQRIKLVHGIDGVNDGDVAKTNPLPVLAERDLQRIAVTTTVLTIVTTTYTAGDQVGSIFTFPNAARATGGSGVVTGAVLISAADIIGQYDLVLFDSTVTLAGDNAPFAISDPDALKIVGIAQLTGAFDIGNNRIAQAYGLAMPYVCAGGTSLFGSLITRNLHSFFAAVGDLQMNIYVERN